MTLSLGINSLGAFPWLCSCLFVWVLFSFHGWVNSCCLSLSIVQTSDKSLVAMNTVWALLYRLTDGCVVLVSQCCGTELGRRSFGSRYVITDLVLYVTHFVGMKDVIIYNLSPPILLLNDFICIFLVLPMAQQFHNFTSVDSMISCAVTLVAGLQSPSLCLSRFCLLWIPVCKKILFKLVLMFSGQKNWVWFYS